MNRSDLLDLIASLSTACMVMASNLETIDGDLRLAIADALNSAEHTQSAVQTIMMIQDGEL